MAFRYITEPEERLRFAAILADNIADAVIGTDTGENNFRILSWNRAAENLYGWKTEEVIGKTAAEVVPSTMLPEVRKKMMALLNENGYWEGEVVQHNRDGRQIQIHATVSLVKDDSGKVIGAVAVNRDVTGRKRIEENIRQSEEKYRQLSETLDEKVKIRTAQLNDLNSILHEKNTSLAAARSELEARNKQLNEAQQIANLGSWEWNVESGELCWSDNMYRIFEFEPDEKITFEKFTAAVHPEDRERVLQSIGNGVIFNSFEEFYHRITTPSGIPKIIFARGEVIMNEKGKVVRMIGTGQDVTTQKTTEQQLIRQMEELKKLSDSDIQKNNFIAMASHELKTPITSIKGYVQLLLNAFEKEKNEEKVLPPLLVRSSLKSVDKQISRLTRLISELLDLSKIETGTLELKKEEFMLNELAIETVEDILYTNPKHQINIFHDFHHTVFADKDRVGQVMINFLTNAIKYSPNSQKVNVYIQKIGEDEIGFRVEDFGIGINEAEQQKIFERFYRAGGKDEQTYPGFGIGLFIANEFIQKHGGRMMVKSEKGKGSNFTFTLPLTKKD